MQINKKIFTVAITALLLLSVLAVALPANAFDATSTVVLSAATGTVGTTITVSGAAAGSPTGANPFGPIGVYWDNLGTLLNGTTFAASDGSYSAKVKIPAATAGAHFIIVQDSLGTTASAGFTVTPKLAASVTRALPGDTVTLTGTGFAPTATGVITITYTSTTLGTPVTGTFTTVPAAVTTNATGSFSAVVTIPTLTTAQFDTYTFTAHDTATVPNTASVNVVVNYYVTATPAQGPPGITTTIAGRIPPSTAYTVTISGSGVAETQIASGTTSATGAFSNTYTIPSLLAANPYVIKVIWAVVNQVTTGFTVTAAPAIALAPTSGPPNTLVTVTGTNFVASANVTLTFGTTVVNSTVTDSRFGPTDATGALSAVFSVPNLTPGTYVVTVTDQYGAAASAVGGFTISAAPATTVTTAAAFAQGDTISFTITTTDPAVTSVAVMIKDPNGLYWWGTPDLAITWPVIFDAAGFGYTPYTFQLAYGTDNMHLVLPANAPIGAWNWTITLPTAATSLPLKRTGLFTVNAVGATGNVTNADLNATLNTINTKLNTLNVTVNGLTTSISALDAKVTSITGSIATLSTSMGTVTASVNSLSSSISSISGGIATIQTTLGTVTTSLSSLDAVLGAVAGDTATLKTSVGDVTTSLASIGTQVTAINGNVATIQTDVGTLKGTVTSINGNIATIQTDIGTLKADVSSTKSATDSLSPLVIVAIVLALIAAIAAIASIVLMRRKIAG